MVKINNCKVENTVYVYINTWIDCCYSIDDSRKFITLIQIVMVICNAAIDNLPLILRFI